MQRTTVYLSEETAIALRKMAELRGRSQAELIREAINNYLDATEGNQLLPPGTGAYRSGRTDVSTNAEELMKKAARGRG